MMKHCDMTAVRLTSLEFRGLGSPKLISTMHSLRFFNDPTAGAGGAAFADSVTALATVRDTANNNIINNISPPAAT